MTNRELLDEVNGLPGKRRARIRRRLKDAGMMAAGLLAVLALSAAAPIDTRAAGWESLGTWKLTAYCPEECCNGSNAHRTASGEPMVVGETVAVGHLPFGTRLLIDGHEYTVTDRGVIGKHVDILHESHSAAKKFGVHYEQVFIWKED